MGTCIMGPPLMLTACIVSIASARAERCATSCPVPVTRTRSGRFVWPGVAVPAGIPHQSVGYSGGGGSLNTKVSNVTAPKEQPVPEQPICVLIAARIRPA